MTREEARHYGGSLIAEFCTRCTMKAECLEQTKPAESWASTVAGGIVWLNGQAVSRPIPPSVPPGTPVDNCLDCGQLMVRSKRRYPGVSRHYGHGLCEPCGRMFNLHGRRPLTT